MIKPNYEIMRQNDILHADNFDVIYELPPYSDGFVNEVFNEYASAWLSTATRQIGNDEIPIKFQTDKLYHNKSQVPVDVEVPKDLSIDFIDYSNRPIFNILNKWHDLVLDYKKNRQSTSNSVKGTIYKLTYNTQDNFLQHRLNVATQAEGLLGKITNPSMDAIIEIFKLLNVNYIFIYDGVFPTSIPSEDSNKSQNDKVMYSARFSIDTVERYSQKDFFDNVNEDHFKQHAINIITSISTVLTTKYSKAYQSTINLL